MLAWLRLLADPTDAAAVVRALARPPIELRSVDIARCTQIARRRKLDMVSAMAAATESPQVPPEARERIRVFLKLYRAGMAAIDTSRPDLYVHRLIERLGLRRQQLFAAQADVVERLRALAAVRGAGGRLRPAVAAGDGAGVRASITAVADSACASRRSPTSAAAGGVQVLTLRGRRRAGGRPRVRVGLHAGLAARRRRADPGRAAGRGSCRADDADGGGPRCARRCTWRSAGRTGGWSSPIRGPTTAGRRWPRCRPGASPAALGAVWIDREEELFGPAEALHSTYRLLRDELMEGTIRAGGRLGELRFDTDLDVSHAVVRYLELLKLAALIARPEGQSVADSLRDVNSRILQAVTAEQREIFESSSLDDYLLDSERDARRGRRRSPRATSRRWSHSCRCAETG